MKQDEKTLESVETVETNLKETIACIEKNHIDILCIFEYLEKIANLRTEIAVPNMQELLTTYLQTQNPRKEVIETYNSILLLLITIFENKAQIWEMSIALDNDLTKKEVH